MTKGLKSSKEDLISREFLNGFHSLGMFATRASLLKEVCFPSISRFQLACEPDKKELPSYQLKSIIEQK